MQRYFIPGATPQYVTAGQSFRTSDGVSHPKTALIVWTEPERMAIGAVPKPGAADYQEVIEGADGWIVQDKVLSDYKTERKADLASVRYDHEVGGTTVNAMAVNTDRDTQAKLIAARIMAKEDATYSVNWKLPTGFVTLDAPTIIAIADGVRAHVQAAFDREKALLSEIEAATTHADLDAIDINAGWPG